MVTQSTSTRSNAIKRKHLVYSLITGLFIGAIAGAPFGWIAYRYYYQQRLAQFLLCREQNRNQPAAYVDSICGRSF
ncbi:MULTISPECIES: hypothetical protein [Nostocales]|uniref:Uncharacterized protein n=3 Tax=Nostocales TaxID=1161 RepID=A0A8S9TDD4_9CYAN|nr:hypothetical protein [Tolypothrix bouteillei]KAF3890007.1 hypothetical protein DA73_0400034515 [Tolypothrix bouteillei VB521301]